MKNKEWILQLYRLCRLSGNPTIWELWKRSEYDNWSRLDFFYTKNEAMLKCAMFGIVEDDVQEDSSIDDKCKRKKQ